MRKVLLVLLLTLVLALAGCTQPQEVDGGETGGTDGDDGGDGADGGDGQQEFTEEEAMATYRSAFSTLDEADGVTERFSMELTASSGDASGMTGEMGMLFDLEGQRVIVHMTGDLFQDEDGSDSMIPVGAGAMLLGQVGKTTFFGGTESLIAMYNESAEPVESWQDFEDAESAGPGGAMGGDDGSGDADDGASPSDPDFFFDLARDVPDDAEVSYEPTTHDGMAALRVTIDGTDGNATVHLEAVVLLDPERPVSIDATFSDPTAEDPADRAGSFQMSFAYGDDAVSPYEESLIRAESMTILSDSAFEDAFSFGSDDDANASAAQTWTIQPSINPGLVPLDELEVLVTESSMGMEAEESTSDDVVLTLPAEDGSAENDVVSLTYEDADGDGHVSPGDTITLVPADDNATYTIGLRDEVTGVLLVPGPGPLMGLALVGLAALVTRRRWNA